MKKDLTVQVLRDEAQAFSARESKHPEPSIYGVTDGKAVGTYLEHKFRDYLRGPLGRHQEMVEGEARRSCTPHEHTRAAGDDPAGQPA